LEQYYLRQRFYDAETGRFTRRDTYEGRIGEPITLHKYLYASANPAIYIDPSGLVASLNESIAANNIRDILAKSYGEVGQRILQVASQGGNPAKISSLFTDLAWDLGFQAMPHVNALLQKIGRGRRSNLARVGLYRDALNLNSRAARQRNFAFADVFVGDEQATLLSLSGESYKVGTVGPYPFPRQNFNPFTWPRNGNNNRRFDTEVKILESIANRYYDNRSIGGRIVLFTERRPCGSCASVIREFEALFPNIQVRVNFNIPRN